jgi:carboxylesterase type B
VVVHGSSAGAGGIADLLYTHDGENRGLFAGVIMDGIASNPKAYPNETEPHFELFSSQMGCSNATDQMACL